MFYTNVKDKLFPHPAQKWLYVSLLGFAMFLISLGMHVTGASGQSGSPLPEKVQKQVFGFEMYYFKENKIPSGLSLKSESPKFFGNALMFDLVNSKQNALTVSETAVPADFKSTKNPGDISIETEIGSGMVSSPKDGKVTGWLLTKDKTLIKVDATDPYKEDTVEDILRTLTHIEKPSVTNP